MDYKKRVIFLVVIVLLAFPALATQYNTTIEKNLKSTIDFGNISLGSIVLNTFKTDNKQFLFIGNSLNITILDSVKNNYTYPIRIGDYILSVGDTVQFVNGQNLEIKNVSDNYVFGNLLINNISKPRINLSSNSFSSFSINFSKNNFLPDDAEIININLNYSGIVEAGEYELNMKLNNISFNHKFNVTQTRLFDITSQDCLTSFEIGKSGLFCRLGIINKGNTPLEMKLRISDYSDYFYFLTTSLFVNQNKSIDIMYDTKSLNTVINNKQINVSLYDTNVERSFLINISFSDKQAPGFSEVNVTEQMMAHKKYNLTYKINENFGVNSTYARIMDTSGNKIADYLTNNSQFNQYYFEYEPTDLGNFMVEFYAKDNNGNENTTRQSFSVIMLKAFNISDNVNFKKSMNTRYSMKIIGESLEGQEIKIILKELSYNCTWKMKIIDGKDNEYFFENINQSIAITNVGTIRAGFMGDCLKAYDGKFGYEVPSFAELVGDTVFTGDVIDYEIPDEFTDNNWNGGKLKCVVTEKDNLEDSTYDCEMSIPLSNSSGGIIPVTKKQMDNSESLFQQQIDKLKSKNNWKWFFLIIMTFILIIVLLIVWFLIYVNPYLFIKSD